MSKESNFLIYCMERYRHSKGLSGAAVAKLFENYGVYGYITKYFEALHTMSEIHLFPQPVYYIVFGKRRIPIMKKKYSTLQAVSLAGVLLIGCLAAAGCGGSDSTASGDLTKVTLNEVAHSIFYAPQYVAIEKGYFAEEGIDLDLVTGFGADKVMTAVLSGEADIGFMGSESSIYVYSQNPDDYIVNFAQLTQRAGNFLVAREAMADFEWADLKGKNVLGGRKGGIHISM